MTECQTPKLLTRLRGVMCLQFVKNDNNGISQAEVTDGESTYYKKSDRVRLTLNTSCKMAENREVQFKIKKQTEQACG